MITLLFLLALQTPPEGMASIPADEFWMGRVHYFLIDEVGWSRAHLMLQEFTYASNPGA